MKTTLHSYRELIVWQKSIDLVTALYRLTEKFPRSEVYGLTSQIKRCSISIPSNIAEGRYRGTRKDFVQFLRVSYASGAELETQLEIAKRLSFLSTSEYNETCALLSEIMRMLNSMIAKLGSYKQ